MGWRVYINTYTPDERRHYRSVIEMVVSTIRDEGGNA